MPVETRTLLFDENELRSAVQDHVVRKEIASAANRLLAMEIAPEAKGNVLVSLADGDASPRKIELSYGEVAEALIQYCKGHQIPLPRYGDKRLTPAGDGMALMVRMVFSRPADQA